MKIGLVILALAAIAPAGAQAPEGKTYTRVGDTTVGSDGTTYTRVGDATVRNDGTVYTQVGNTMVGSDGSSSTRVGDTTLVHGADGSMATCATIGMTTTCN